VYLGGELRKINNGLYERLRRDGLLGGVPTVMRVFGDDPIQFYKTHHDGVNRAELKSLNSGLYERLRRDGLLDVVPTVSSIKPADFGNDPVAYYHKHHSGLTRGQLQNKNHGLYNRLTRDGLLGVVPLVDPIYGNDPVAYYREHFPDLTRGQLRKRSNGLYERLRRDGLLDGVPTLQSLKMQLQH